MNKLTKKEWFDFGYQLQIYLCSDNYSRQTDKVIDKILKHLEARCLLSDIIFETYSLFPDNRSYIEGVYAATKYMLEQNTILSTDDTTLEMNYDFAGDFEFSFTSDAQTFINGVNDIKLKKKLQALLDKYANGITAGIDLRQIINEYITDIFEVTEDDLKNIEEHCKLRFGDYI